MNQIIACLNSHLSKEIIFVDDCVGQEAFEKTANLNPGNVVLLENLRFYAQEKKGDREFSEKLSNLEKILTQEFWTTSSASIFVFV